MSQQVQPLFSSVLQNIPHLLPNLRVHDAFITIPLTLEPNLQFLREDPGDCKYSKRIQTAEEKRTSEDF